MKPEIPVQRIEQAARLLRLWSSDRQRANGKWTTQEQAAVDCAIDLEEFLRNGIRFSQFEEDHLGVVPDAPTLPPTNDRESDTYPSCMTN